MKYLKEIDHIGYAVRDIMTTAKFYIENGWTISKIYKEEVQNTQIAFLNKAGMMTIELVSPLKGPSPIDNLLKSNGEVQYHFCNRVEI